MDVLKSELAGRWYVDDQVRLAREVDTYLDFVDPEPIDDLIALILPHAGYRYSGIVAAHGVKLLEGRSVKRVVVIGPSHQVAMLDSVSIPDVTHIETPLGLIPLDREAISRLWQNPSFESHPYAHTSEHSVQIELPFLQQALNDFLLIPIVCGQLTAASARRIGNELISLMDGETVLVVSSDFTHYGQGFDYVPFTDDIKSNIESLDMGAFRLIEQKDLEGFLDYVRTTGATICGSSPVSVLLSMLGADVEVRLLKYETSGNLTEDWSHCVSYISAAFSGHWKKNGKTSEDQAQTSVLTETEKADLLAFARQTIASRFRRIEPEVDVTPAMEEVMGAFVTLHKHGDLRGCIGEIFPRRPLIEVVKEHAMSSAFKDPRFPKLREDELHDIDIEISALTPPVKVASYEDIEIGRHGIVLSKGMCSAVFLPQVAREQGWDRATTLTQLSMKAGLPPQAWQDDECEFNVFEAVVFGERP